jgi:Domain of unknown function (DUF6398)
LARTSACSAGFVERDMSGVHGDSYRGDLEVVLLKTLSRAMAAALCRKRQNPLRLGQPKSWACGIVYVLGRVNFLDDPSFHHT